LPSIVSISSRLATYATPKVFFVGPEKREVRQAIEITVETAAPIPARSLSPVIWVGEARVIEYEMVAPNRYKFYAIEPSRLRDGAAIAFGWPDAERGRPGGAAAQRTATNFRFRLGGPAIA
jgi:hypothetical protein